MRQRAISAIKGLASGADESAALRLHGNHFAHTALIQRSGSNVGQGKLCSRVRLEGKWWALWDSNPGPTD